jgi:hypothetical protein
MLMILNIPIILNKVRKNYNLSQPKQELRKNLAFVGYEIPKLDYRGKNCPVK